MRQKEPEVIGLVRLPRVNQPSAAGRIKWLTNIVYSSPFELFIAFVILVNATSLAILTMPELDESVRRACEQIDLVCFAIYAVELVMRLISYGKRPWDFFKTGWNVFDFIVIAASPIFAGQTVVLRLLRLLRLFRIFRFLPEVRVINSMGRGYWMFFVRIFSSANMNLKVIKLGSTMKSDYFA